MAVPADRYAAPAWYGGVAEPTKRHMEVSNRRRRMRFSAILMALLIPCGIFVGIYAVLSFSIHYQFPWSTAAVVLGTFIAVLAVGLYAQRQRNITYTDGQREPSWLYFLFLSMMIAWVCAVIGGMWTYENSMKPYYQQHDLNIYIAVNPSNAAGQGMMDAGSIIFDEGTRLDTTKSMGFKHNDVYCAAPITFGNTTLATYDFWAVGKNCCSGSQADFHCDGYNHQSFSSGLRLMGDADRAYYRLAVQQAEATYKIQAVHPLFFTWVGDAPGIVESWREEGRQQFVVGSASFFVLQAFMTTVAAIAFSAL